MYTRFQLCSDLKPKQKCFKLRRYNEGLFEDVFHEHVPNHRVSLDDALAMMRTLVLRYEGHEASSILRHYLNTRGRKPSARHLRFDVEYPEPGVIRRYCSSNHIHAWMDEVISPEQFRP